MSTRRARIKPAINLAASRRSAGSKPGPAKPSARPKQRVPQAKTVEKSVPKKPPDSGGKSVPPEEPEKAAVTEKHHVGRAGAKSGGLSSVGETTAVKETAVVKGTTAVEESAVVKGTTAVQEMAGRVMDEGVKTDLQCEQADRTSREDHEPNPPKDYPKPVGHVPAADPLPAAGPVPAAGDVSAAEGEKQETKSSEPDAKASGASKNPVRRKRISAIPNINKRRLPGATPSKGMPAAKKRPVDNRTTSKVGQSKVEHSKVHQPRVGHPKAAEPKADDVPVVNEPAIEKPVADQPLSDGPEGKYPKVDQPKAGQPKEDLPKMDHSSDSVSEAVPGVQPTADLNHPPPGETQREPSKEASRDAGEDGDTLGVDEVIEDRNCTGEKGTEPTEPPAIQRKIFSQPLQKFNQMTDEATAKRRAAETHKNNIYKRKLEEIKSMKREETASHRRRKYAYCAEDGIDPSKMRMRDLIYFNPKENRMSSRDDSPAGKESVTKRHSIPRSDDEDEDPDEAEEPSVSAAPQVTIGPDGNIVLDKQSLVKVVTPKRKLDESEITEVKEDSSTTTYSSFRKSTYSASWSKEETAKFYRALNAVGTDFSMINAIFPNRRRRELKNKFKREERINAERMERTLRDVRTFDYCDFQNMDEDERAEEEGEESTKAEDKTFKKPGRKRKKKRSEDPKGVYVMPRSRKSSTEEGTPQTTEETTPSSVASQPSSVASKTSTPGDKVDDTTSKKAIQTMENPFGLKDVSGDNPTTEKVNSDGEEENYDMESILGKPTRSGRQPKQKELFTIEEPPSQPRSIGPDGEISRGKRKAAKEKGKRDKKRVKRKKEKAEATGLSSTEVISRIGGGASRVPPLHPDGRTGAYNPLQGPPRSTTKQPAPQKTEHYLITYPDGRRTLIQMPVPLGAKGNFDFVFNVLPSPVREGGVLQLQAVPRPSKGSVPQNVSVSLPKQPNNPNQTGDAGAPAQASFNLTSPSHNASLGGGNQVNSGLLHRTTLSSGSRDSTSTQGKPPEPPILVPNSPLLTTSLGRLPPMQGSEKVQESPGHPETSQSGPKGLPFIPGSSFTLNTSGRSLVPNPAHSTLASSSGTLNASHVGIPLGHGPSRTGIPQVPGNQRLQSRGGKRNHNFPGMSRFPYLGPSPFRAPSSSTVHRQGGHGLSEQLLSAIADPPTCLQKSHPGLTSPLPSRGVNNPTTVLSRLLSPPLKGQTLPPVASLLSRSPYELDVAATPPEEILTSHPPQLLTRNDSGGGPPLGDSSIISDKDDSVHQDARGLEMPGGLSVGSEGVIEVESGPLPGLGTGGGSTGDEVVYMPGLEQPMLESSELSDLSVGQQVDVSSSVPRDDSVTEESEEAFVPVGS